MVIVNPSLLILGAQAAGSAVDPVVPSAMSSVLVGLAMATIASGLVLLALMTVRLMRWPVELPRRGVSNALGTVPRMLAYAHSVERRYAVVEPANPLANYRVQDLRTGDVVSQHFELSKAQRRAAELNVAASLHIRRTRSCLCLYSGRRPAKLVAVWRWSRGHGGPIAYDPRRPDWSPTWTREFAERAWESR
jgi:hypothetical protein